MDKKSQIAVVGVTGVIGREVLRQLAEAGHPPEKVTALASERSEGEEVEYGEETLEVERATDDALRGMKAVILAAPEDASKKFAPLAQANGSWVVDLSAAFRQESDIPLVNAQTNPDALKTGIRGRIVATPSPLALALSDLAQAFRTAGHPIRSLTGTALVGASVQGLLGIRELEQQTAALLSGKDAPVERFAHRIAFNVFPQVGEMTAEGVTADELAAERETARLVAKAPSVSLTAFTVPTFYGQALSLGLSLETVVEAGKIRESLRSLPGVKVLDAPEEKVYPMLQLVTDDTALHLGRFRNRPDGRLSLVCAYDNAGRAAQNALAITALLLARA